MQARRLRIFSRPMKFEPIFADCRGKSFGKVTECICFELSRVEMSDVTGDGNTY